MYCYVTAHVPSRNRTTGPLLFFSYLLLNKDLVHTPQRDLNETFWPRNLASPMLSGGGT
jgi:hypothetical protein